MRSIQGNLSLMTLSDLFQWADNSKRTGTLSISQQGSNKKFYLQEGKVIFIWSDSRGERLVDYLRLESAISQEELKEIVADAENLGLPFIGYLLSQNIISQKKLNKICRQVAHNAMTDALKWETGDFEFVDTLPTFVLNGPVKLDSMQLLMESVQTYDETGQEDSVDLSQIINEIRNRINQGNIELPPIPDIIQKISERIEDPNIPIEKVAECITDQILVTKILRICNSPFYRSMGKVSSLREAVVRIGFKSLLSIVTVHALSSFSPRNVDEIRKVLQHCLVCAMIARQIARDMGANYELAFMCGLLHDIGKTLMFDIAADYMLSADVRNKLIHDYHGEIGCMLAQKWNFGEDIQESIMFHHNPENAGAYRSMVDIIFLADLMAHSSGETGSTGELFLSWAEINSSVEVRQENIVEIMDNLEHLDEDAKAIML